MGAEAPPPPSLSDEQKQALTQCAVDLASENFETRTKASRTILALGDPALPELITLQAKAKDPEVSSRLKSLINNLQRQRRQQEANARVSVDVKDAPLSTVLDTVLTAAPNWKEFLRGDDKLQGRLDTPVTLILKNVRVANALKWTYAAAGLWQMRPDDAALATGTFNVMNLPMQPMDMQALIKERLRPAAFANPATSIEEQGGILTVVQTPEVLEDIAKFVDLIDRGRKEATWEVPLRETAGNAEIQKLAAESLVSFDFNDKPLGTAVAELQKQVNVTLIANKRVCDLRLTLCAQRMPLDAALDWIGMLTNTTVVFENEAAAIYSMQDWRSAQSDMTIYSVDDLTERPKDWEGAPGSLPTITNIADMIRTRVRPETWDAGMGTSIEERSGRLVVMQLPDVHREIRASLDDLRRYTAQVRKVEPRGRAPQKPLPAEQVPSAGEAVADPPAWIAGLRTALEKKISVEFAGTRLTQALRKISADTGANIVVDPRSLSQGDPEITLKLADTRAEAVIAMVLRQADLTSEFKKHAILVGRHQDIKPGYDVRSFYVNDLSSLMDSSSLITLIQDYLLPEDFADPCTCINESGGSITMLQRAEVHQALHKFLAGFRLHYGDASFAPEPAPAASGKAAGPADKTCVIYNVSKLTEEERARISTAMITRKEWIQDGAGGKVLGKYLVAVQTSANHQLLAEHLQELEKNRKPSAK